MQSSKTDRLLRGAIVLLSAVLVYFIYSGIHERVVVAGDSAPDFTIQADNGRTVSLPNFGGKLLVLNFWASWCPPCVEETPSLSQLAADFAGKGVVVLGVSVDKDEKAYRAFLQKFTPRSSPRANSKFTRTTAPSCTPRPTSSMPTARCCKNSPNPPIGWTRRMTQLIDSLL